MRELVNGECQRNEAVLCNPAERINFAKGASRTGSRSTTGGENQQIRELANGGGLSCAEGNGEFRKRAERGFGEKRV